MNESKMTDNAFSESGYLATDDPWLEDFNYYQLFDRILVLPNDELKIIESDYDYEIKIGHKAFSKVLFGYNTNTKMYMFLKLIPNQKIIINTFINDTDNDKYLGKLVESHSVIIKPELTTHVDYCNKFIKKYMEIQNKRELVTFDTLTSNLKDYIIRFLLRLRCHTKWSKYDTSLIVGYSANFGANTVILSKESLCYPVISLYCNINDKSYNIVIYQKDLLDHYKLGDCKISEKEGTICEILSTIYNQAKSCCPSDFSVGLIKVIDECFYNIEE